MCERFTYRLTWKLPDRFPQPTACFLSEQWTVDDPKATFYVEFKPVNDASVPGAMKVVGRTLQDFAEAGRDPKEAMVAFRDWIASVAKNARPVFVGFNATFDWAFVNFYFHQLPGRESLRNWRNRYQVLLHGAERSHMGRHAVEPDREGI